MHNIVQDLAEKFHRALLAAFPEHHDILEELPIEVVQSSQEKFGHYQCNTPMRLAKPLQRSPRHIAEAVVQKVERAPQIAKLEIAGPGFINITIASDYLSETCQEMLDDPHLGIEPPKHKQRIIVEFSSPNTAKELHVGHLRSTIIGDCLARVFEFLGHDVLRLNHIGDWGTSFGMLIAYLKETHPKVLTGEENTDLSHLVGWYKASKKRFDEDAEFKKRSQLEVVSLQGGEPEALSAWEIICDISRQAYQEIYNLLDVKLTERGESFYNPMLADTIADLEKKGLIEVSDGAKCIFLPEFKNREGTAMPLMMQKSDGGYGYDTTDIAAMRHRTEEEKVERIIILTDAGQSQHFQMIHAGCDKSWVYRSQNHAFRPCPLWLGCGR